MAIAPEIGTLLNRLNQELDETEQEATNGLNLLRPILSQFPENYLLVQFYAFFNTALFFVVDSRRRIQETVEIMSPQNVTEQEIQEMGEQLGNLLGRVLEVKINSRQLKNRLDNWL